MGKKSKECGTSSLSLVIPWDIASEFDEIAASEDRKTSGYIQLLIKKELRRNGVQPAEAEKRVRKKRDNEKKHKRTGVSVPVKLAEQFKEFAEKKEVYISNYITGLIKKEIKRVKKQNNES